MHFERGMPARGVIIGRLLADDARFVANTPAQSPEMLRWLLEAEPLGARGVVTNRDGANTFVPTPFGTSMGSAS